MPVTRSRLLRAVRSAPPLHRERQQSAVAKLSKFLAHEHAGHAEPRRKGNVADPGFHKAMTSVKVDGAERRFDVDSCGTT
jgi:hypothetical protein